MSNADSDQGRQEWATAANCTVIVVTFNSVQTVVACLGSIEAAAATIVVDNASHDATAAIVANDFPSVRLVRSSSNVGFGAACNRAAALSDREWLLLLNPDAQLDTSCLDALLHYAAAHPSSGNYGAFASFPDGRPTLLSGFQRATVWSVFASASGLRALFPGSSWFDPEAVQEPCSATDPGVSVSYVSGACLLIRTALWRDLGGFNPAYFMYGEDADLCLRARQQGYRPELVPSARIVHEVGGSTANWASRQIQLLAGKATLLRLHWPPVQRRLVSPLMLAHVLWRLTLTSLISPFSTRIKAQRRGWSVVWNARGDWSRGYDASGIANERPEGLRSMHEANRS